MTLKDSGIPELRIDEQANEQFDGGGRNMYT